MPRKHYIAVWTIDWRNFSINLYLYSVSKINKLDIMRPPEELNDPFRISFPTLIKFPRLTKGYKSSTSFLSITEYYINLMIAKGMSQSSNYCPMNTSSVASTHRNLTMFIQWCKMARFQGKLLCESRVFMYPRYS